MKIVKVSAYPFFAGPKNLMLCRVDTDEGVYVFHSGTRLTDGELRTSSGRVLSVVSFGDTKEECARKVYDGIKKISYDGMHYRKDIGTSKK